MGLTFRKRDDFDKMMDTLGVSNVDLVSLGDDLTTKNDHPKDPFAKFLDTDIHKQEDDLSIKFSETETDHK
ncbi:SPJ_0845 family protein [Lactococcus fujiensis]|uniref:Uncharacterized protein n=1 Tax=Lactococcus fujiensis JCM 16395 TaxID=1291764 RepID=A0A2A5RMD8_9LACT|nr:SPJ_0845 family protein [Lactococcus fujiensis]PCS00453.1 hypothetical protein RT41_GL001340 [Lactococcus fujiensis JCM 16395]